MPVIFEWSSPLLRTALRLALTGLLAGGACIAQAQSSSADIAINLTILSKNNCRFKTAPPAQIAFGVLDQTRSTDISLSVPATFSCQGKSNIVTYAVSVDNGLNHDGTTRRLKTAGATPSFMAYSASASPASGNAAKGDLVGLTITATIPVDSFQQAAAGLYSDTITVTVQP